MLLVPPIKVKHISSAQNPLCEGAEEHFGWMEISWQTNPRAVPISSSFSSWWPGPGAASFLQIVENLEPVFWRSLEKHRDPSYSVRLELNLLPLDSEVKYPMILAKPELIPYSSTSARGALLGLKKCVCHLHSACLCIRVAFQTKHMHTENILGRVLTSLLFLERIMNWWVYINTA